MKLILAPHADDETLGCGGLIAKDPNGVTVAVMSDKDDGRMDEFEAARKILGYHYTYEPTFPTGELQANARGLVTRIDQLVRALKPMELYLPAPGIHQDHIAVYEAGIRAARLSYTSGSWFVPTVLLYEVPGYALDLYNIPYKWNRYVTLDDEQMAKKMDAIRAYKSQNDGGFDPAALAEEQANILGRRVGVRYAEQYAVIREVVA